MATNVASETKRKVHFWFFTTHAFKAIRGQLFTSRPDGKKAFKSAQEGEFGSLPVKLLEWLEEDKAKTDGKVSHNVRLSEKVANPKNQLKMSVHLVNDAFEHSIIAYAITKLSKQLAITPKVLKTATAEVMMNHPFRRIISQTEHGEEGEDRDVTQDNPMHASDLCFGGWKVVQLKRKKQRDPNWEKSFMAQITYRNLRKCLCGFFHFSRYMLTEVFPGEDGLTSIPMLCGNKSSLESKFSSQQRTGHNIWRCGRILCHSIAAANFTAAAAAASHYPPFATNDISVLFLCSWR